MSGRRFIGPKFFEETVTAQRYRNNIPTAFAQELQDDELQDGFFQHDGATAHTTIDNLIFLPEFLFDRVISLHSVFEYPQRSPNLTSLILLIHALILYNLGVLKLHCSFIKSYSP